MSTKTTKNGNHGNSNVKVVGKRSASTTTTTYSTEDLYLRLKDANKMKKVTSDNKYHDNIKKNNRNNDVNDNDYDNNQNHTSTMILPNVLLIGTQKAGTTSISKFIFDILGACHPTVLDGEPSFHIKEVHYFDEPDSYNQGISFYAKHYEHCNRSGLILDATPATLRMAHEVYKTYHEVNRVDDVKMIVILREPISRELSIYNHIRDIREQSSSGMPWLTFQQYFDMYTMREINQEPQPTNMGMYAYYLRQWFQYFNRKQILLLHYDELVHNPKSIIERISEFLVLNDTTTTTTDDYEHNYSNTQLLLQHTNEHNSPNKVTMISCDMIEYMSKIYDPLNDDLYHLLQRYNDDDDDMPPSMEQNPFPKFMKPINCTTS